MTAAVRSTGRRVAVAAVSLLGTAALIALILGAVDLREVADAAASASASWLLLAFTVAFFFKTVQSAETARWVLQGLGQRVLFAPLLAGTLGGLALREVLPSGTGNLSRAAYLVRRHEVPAAAAATAELAILWIKLAWLLLFCGIGIFATPEVAPAYAAVPGLGLLAWIGGTAFARPLVRRARRWTDGRPRLQRVATDLDESLYDLEPVACGMAALHTLLAIIGEWVVFALLLVALGHPAPIGSVVAFVPIIAILTKLPVSFMGLGAREGLVLVLFAPYAPGSVLVAAGLLSSLLDRIVPSVLGAVVTPVFVARIVEGRSSAA